MRWLQAARKCVGVMWDLGTAAMTCTHHISMTSVHWALAAAVLSWFDLSCLAVADVRQRMQAAAGSCSCTLHPGTVCHEELYEQAGTCVR